MSYVINSFTNHCEARIQCHAKKLICILWLVNLNMICYWRLNAYFEVYGSILASFLFRNISWRMQLANFAWHFCPYSTFLCMHMHAYMHVCMHTCIHLCSWLMILWIILYSRSNSFYFIDMTKALPTDRRTNRRIDGPTDRRTDRLTNRRTYPLIEMRGRI